MRDDMTSSSVSARLPSSICSPLRHRYIYTFLECAHSYEVDALDLLSSGKLSTCMQQPGLMEVRGVLRKLVITSNYRRAKIPLLQPHHTWYHLKSQPFSRNNLNNTNTASKIKTKKRKHTKPQDDDPNGSAAHGQLHNRQQQQATRGQGHPATRHPSRESNAGPDRNPGHARGGDAGQMPPGS